MKLLMITVVAPTKIPEADGRGSGMHFERIEGTLAGDI
jgi:hypothetical protein